ncbi:hypothetical protein HF086_010480 [Spodoptera exigua]|uniref:Uncharacterized protein n=1 Tax=Spodoptera exigua TaxID=7107 RepID=A0A922MWN6_SPOEX|nr:hypothetical protein HF086_010480 [Spodoptera exigua]
MLEDQDSAVKFIRHEMPTFTYEDNYQLSTPAPVTEPDPVALNIYRNIQYAPLINQNNLKNKNTATDMTSITDVPKSHLEPRVPSQLNSEAMKCYSPEQTAEVLTVSRSPGHNAIYRSLSEPVLTNIVRPFAIFHNVEPLTTTLPTFELPSETVAKTFSVKGIANNHYGLNPNNMEVGPGINKIKRQFSPYAKLHRLHLNIARVYSPGQMPPMAPLYPDTYSSKYERSPVHPQGYVPPAYQALPKKTRYIYQEQAKPQDYHFQLP